MTFPLSLSGLTQFPRALMPAREQSDRADESPAYSSTGSLCSKGKIPKTASTRLTKLAWYDKM